ncbi:hypothetical protein KR026_009710 [Drosophila bipectinata]|nr:hypothetical protein KR026_009710 [Drosophila bipectinata]
MFRLHCNKCFSHKKHVPSLNFFISNCKHILCDGCMAGSSKDRKCPLCEATFKPIPISPNMPEKVAYYFEDPKRFLELYRKISKFQADQRDSDDRGFQVKMRKHLEMKRKLDTYLRMEEQLQQHKKRQERQNYYDDTPSSEDGERGVPKKVRRTQPPTPSTTSSEEFLTVEDNERFLQYFQAALAENDKEPESWSKHRSTSFKKVLDFDS